MVSSQSGNDGMCNNVILNSINSFPPLKHWDFHPEYSMINLAFSSVLGGVSIATGISDTSGLLRDDDERIWFSLTCALSCWVKIDRKKIIRL